MSSRKLLLLASAALAALLLGLLLPRPPWPGAGDPGKSAGRPALVPEAGEVHGKGTS